MSPPEAITGVAGASSQTLLLLPLSAICRVDANRWGGNHQSGVTLQPAPYICSPPG